MGIELVLATFKGESGEPTDAQILQRLADTVRTTLRKWGRTDEDVEALAEQVLVDLPSGTAEIHSDHAFFRIEELDPLTVNVVFDVAKTGDMVVLTEGGHCSTILMNPSQRARLPYEEWQSEHASPMCRSPKQLEGMLESWYRFHSEFKHEAVADWTAKSKLNRSAATPSSDVTTYRWDPWVSDMVPNGPEAELVRLHRFDPAGNEIPKHPDVLRDLRVVCERHLRATKERSSRLIDDREWPPLELKMRFCSADMWPDRVDFQFYELNDSVATLVYQIARTGDMSFILPGGLILADIGQGARVPQSWKETKRIVSCQSAEELKSLLRSLQLDISPEDRGYGFDNDEPVPGTSPQRARAVYIEAKPKESAVKHQMKVYKHKPQSSDGPFRPEHGLLMAGFWQLETPSGQQFYAYSYGGVGWMAYLRDFASSEERMLGSIVNFETFAQGDGQRFAISACKICKVEP